MDSESLGRVHAADMGVGYFGFQGEPRVSADTNFAYPNPGTPTALADAVVERSDVLVRGRAGGGAAEPGVVGPVRCGCGRAVVGGGPLGDEVLELGDEVGPAVDGDGPLRRRGGAEPRVDIEGAAVRAVLVGHDCSPGESPGGW